MEKIPTLFMRNPDDRAHVLDQVNPGCEWVIAGAGTATRKYDGTCVSYSGGQWWARREVKPGKRRPAGFVWISTDEVTGKEMGWEPIDQSGFAKHHTEAISGQRLFVSGTYELIGPKINGNPENAPFHMLVRHAAAQILYPPRTFAGLREWLRAFEGEGIVWHHQDGRMAKLKRRDFTY